MHLRDKTKEELLNELQELQKANHSLQESYNRHVSESKKLEISLRLSEEKFRLVFENTSEAILFTQPIRKPAEFSGLAMTSFRLLAEMALLI